MKIEVKINSRWFGKSIHCYTDSSYSRGVSVLFKKDLPVEILDIHRSIDGRKILVNVKLNDNIFSLVNVYAPNNEPNRLDFFKKLKLFISHLCIDENNVIIAGDFNCKIAERNDKSSCKLNDIVNCFELRYIWVDKHKELNGYTWCNGNDIPYSRIGYVFVSSDFHYCIETIIIRRIPGSHSCGNRMSDHRALIFTFRLISNTRSGGYWKLNSSYLEQDDYKAGIKQLCTEVTNMIDIDDIDIWELLKIKAKDFSINFAKCYRNDMTTKIQNIEKEISLIEEADSLTFDVNRKRQLERQLSLLYDEKCKGAQVRSRAKWIKEGEKSTKYFFQFRKDTPVTKYN